MKPRLWFSDFWNGGCFTLTIGGIIIVVLIILFNIFTTSEFDRKNAFMEECLASERYTREECIVLGSNVPR